MLSAYLANTSGTPFVSLLLVVFNSILEVFLLCVAGYLLASRGILDKKTQKQLNRLNVSLFTPALLFSKVAFFLTPEKLRELWVIPIFFVIVTLVSGGVAFVLGWLFKLKRSQRSFAMAAAMFMNSNSLPIALMQSLVVTVPDLKWGDDDSKNAMLGRALTYLVMYSTLGMVLRWSYGVKLLSQADDENQLIEEQTPLLGEFHHAGEEIDSHPTNSRTNSTIIDDDIEHVGAIATPPRPLCPPRRRTTFYNSFPNSPNQSRTNLDQYYPIPSSHVPSDGNAENLDVQQLGGFTIFVRKLKRVFLTFNEFMTVPLWAALASLVVACLPPLQHWLQFNAKPISGAISSAGKCSIPITLVVLGAYFYPNTPESNATIPNQSLPALSTSQSNSTLTGTVKNIFKRKASTNSYNSMKLRRGETKTVIISVVSRMILTPLVLMPLISLSAKYDYHAVFEDPVFVVANVLLVASPPALTLAQITQAASGDAFERLISKTIFWSYCILTPPSTIIVVLLGLMLTRI